MPWHGTSEYPHSSHFRPMDRNELTRWRSLASLAHKRRLITAADHDVAMALAYRLGPEGRCDPTRQTLAEAARCTVRTVARSLARLRACGLVAWTRRIVRRPRIGARQTSNAFRLMLASLAEAARRLAQKPEGQPVPGSFNRMEKKEPPRSAEPTIDQAEAAEALRRVREARAGIVAPPRPAHAEALRNLAELRQQREKALADAIARRREALKR